MRINLVGKKQGKHNSCEIKPCFRDGKSLGRVRILFKLESEDRKRYKEKPILSNNELLPDPNVPMSLLLTCL